MHYHGGAMRRLAAAAVALAMLTCAAGSKITVGDKDGWSPNVNYTQWAADHRHIYVGDWLLFVFDKHYYNVLEVKKSNYERCDDGEFLKNITQGGRDVYELREARSYYFLSSGGYCFNGMKLAIHVRRPPPPPPEAASDVKAAKNGAPPPDRVAAVVMAAIFAFVFKVL